MKKLREQMRSPSNDAQKAEIEAQLQKVNQDFLTGLKKYISADKVAEYEKFISEAKVWKKKLKRNLNIVHIQVLRVLQLKNRKNFLPLFKMSKG